MKKLFFYLLFIFFNFQFASAGTSWDATHSYDYDSATTTLSNVKAIIDNQGDPTDGFDLNLYLADVSSGKKYVIHDYPGNGGLGGSSSMSQHTMILDPVTLSKVKGLPSGKYILWVNASIISGDLQMNDASNYIVFTSTATGINNPDPGTSLQASICPNPTTNRAVFTVTTSLAAEADLSISDISGKQVFHAPVPLPENGENRIEIDLTNFKQGIYSYKIISNNRIVTGKLVKE